MSSEKGEVPPSAPIALEPYPDQPPPYSVYPENYKPQDPKPPLGFQEPPQPAPQQAVIIQAAPVPAQLTVLGPDSVRLSCPHCHADITTTTIKDPSITAYISAVVLFIIGCSLGCCLIPFCMDSCKTVEHRCTNCKNSLANILNTNILYEDF